MLKNLLIFGLLTLLVQSSPLYTRHLYDVSTGARCLDGSPAGIYINEGALKDHIMVYFLGGGYCQGNSLSAVLESCYKRSSTELGTSKIFPVALDLDAFGILSTSQALNPVFWNWTKVFVPYCDGSFHQGYRQNPVEYKDKHLYFRGTNNTLQHFKYLNDTHNLYSAAKVVITGESAGGIATYLWADYVYERSTTKAVYSIPDSGLFLTDYPNPKTGEPTLSGQLKVLIGLVNNQTSIPFTECFKDKKNDFSCLNFSNNVQYFKAPMFIVESAYDQYSLGHILTEKCLSSGSNGAYSLDKCDANSMNEITAYRNASLNAISNFTEMQYFGAWVPSCVQHGFSHENAGWNGATYKVPGSVGLTLASAIQRFLNNPADKKGNTHIDEVQWPQNHGCSAHVQMFNLKRRSSSERFFETVMTQ